MTLVSQDRFGGEAGRIETCFASTLSFSYKQ
jgi:hypothetical protein